MKLMKLLMIGVVVVMLAGTCGLMAGEKGGGAFAKDFLKIWQDAKAYSVEMAELMPEEHYSFKPTPEIMSFGEQVAHTAGATYWFISKITGKENPAKEFKAEGKSKAQIIKFLKDSFDFAEKVLAGLTDKEAEEEVHMWKDLNLKKSKVFLLNRDHVTHHRGAMVIYLRLKGIKPAQYRG